MNKLLLDSNIIIGVIKGRFSVAQLKKPSLLVSEITRLEIYGYHKLRTEEEKFLNKFFKNIECLPITKIIINQSIKLRQQKSMSLGDAIIAATAVIYELHLNTANTKDFIHIKKIELINSLAI
jgi:predicted nucleic acid-binding protein